MAPRIRPLKAKEIEHYLSLLGAELADLGIVSPVRILIVGGAFMLTQIKVRRTTDDIDVLPLFEAEKDEATGMPLAGALWVAAHSVATRHQLPDSWFNTIIADFVQAAGPVPDSIHWHTYGPLEVYLPPKDYILVLKLIAHRDKDKRDIVALCKALHIHTQQQAQQLIDKYIPDAEIQRFFSMPVTLAELFPS